MTNLSTLAPEFSSIPSGEHDSLNQQHKVNGFSSGPFRTSASFASFSNNRTRNSSTSFRDTSSAYTTPSFPPTQPDIFVPNPLPPHMPSQAQQPSPFEGIHHPGRPFDLSMGGSQLSSGIMINGQSKQSNFGGLDSYRMSMDACIPPTHMGKQQRASLAGPPGLMPDTQGAQMSIQSQTNPQQGYQASHLNGISHGLSHHAPLPPQAAFGSSLPINGPGPLQGTGIQGNAMTGASGISHVNGNAQNPQQPQEEISTIFVVGFPEDMSEREFQNMFTFSSGFEAATLKIPNKELTAYGSTGAPLGINARAAGLPLHYAGSNDPYNVLTVNQGGVVVDGGRDGLMASWPAVPMQPDESHFIPSNLHMQPPRKQIIGFAKFRTRQEALEARDVLQGRRVDMEKGSILKAEMAKKNLHTKRGPGVGPLTSLMSGVGGVNGDTLNGLTGLSSGAAGEVFSQRDKELGAMGIAIQRRDRLGGESDDERRRIDMSPAGPIGLAAFGPRGARERAEEDERERERKRKEKEALRLRQNSYAFEAFHSVPQQMVREGMNSLISAENGTMDTNGTGYSGFSSLTSPPDTSAVLNGVAVGPWGVLHEVNASAALRKMSAPVHLQSAAPARPSSGADQQSPPSREAASSPPSATSGSSQNGSTLPTSISAPFSPQSSSSSLPAQSSLLARQRPSSPPVSEPQTQVASENRLPPTSLLNCSASSASGSQNGNDDELARAVGALAVSTSQGTMSPQLPSPASGASSGTGRSPGDQNPPINTLYVGNLPTSSVAGGSPPGNLEERLRDLFSKRQGYRKLCFRQKSNGPMCFIEFEDVSYATQALKELYGHSLDGLVKGGIRLSYSKNPLGVRTPTSGGNGGVSLQQQQQNSQQTVSATQPFFADTFQRPTDIDTYRSFRRDTSGMTSPTSSYHYTMSPPPPRFFNSSPSSAPFAPPLSSPTAFPRANSQGYGLPSSISSTFSPFGIAPFHSTIPDQPSADASNEHLSHVLTPASANIEASRAG